MNDDRRFLATVIRSMIALSAIASCGGVSAAEGTLLTSAFVTSSICAVYGYGRGIELPDGSVLAVYIHTGGHSTKDAQREALWAIRLRVRLDRTGLDLFSPDAQSAEDRNWRNGVERGR